MWARCSSSLVNLSFLTWTQVALFALWDCCEGSMRQHILVPATDQCSLHVGFRSAACEAAPHPTAPAPFTAHHQRAGHLALFPPSLQRRSSEGDWLQGWVLGVQEGQVFFLRPWQR